VLFLPRDAGDLLFDFAATGVATLAPGAPLDPLLAIPSKRFKISGSCVRMLMISTGAWMLAVGFGTSINNSGSAISNATCNRKDDRMAPRTLGSGSNASDGESTQHKVSGECSELCAGAAADIRVVPGWKAFPESDHSSKLGRRT
jgi:hypothetical protein